MDHYELKKGIQYFGIGVVFWIISIVIYLSTGYYLVGTLIAFLAICPLYGLFKIIKAFTVTESQHSHYKWTEKDTLITVIVVLGTLLFLSLAFIYLVFNEPLYEMTFLLEETNESLEGHVYMEDVYLGPTEDGVIYIDYEYLHPGEIVFITTYNGEDQAYGFDFIEEDLSYSGGIYYLTRANLENYTFEE